MSIVRLGKGRGTHQTVRAGNTVYISGQVATDENGEIVGKGDIEAQLEQVYKNLERHCCANGGTLKNIVQTTIYLKDASYGNAARIARDHYEGECPTSTTILVDFPGPDRLVEIESIAYIEE